MKKWLGIILALALTMAFSGAALGEESTVSDWYELDEEEAVLTVRLPANETTGYEWSFDIDDPEILELATMEYVQDEAEEGAVGVGGTWVASFIGTFDKAGETMITFSYARSGDETPAETRALDVFVNESNTIEIVSADAPETALPGEYPVTLTYMSGAGAWSTVLTLQADGTFEGTYSDAEMGETGDDYPDGTEYVCDFTGSFSVEQQTSDTTYVLTLELINMQEPGTEWIDDGIRYVASEPAGLSGTEFLLCLPGTPVAEMDETVLSWWNAREDVEELPCYALCNLSTGDGFYSEK